MNGASKGRYDREKLERILLIYRFTLFDRLLNQIFLESECRKESMNLLKVPWVNALLIDALNYLNTSSIGAFTLCQAELKVALLVLNLNLIHLFGTHTIIEGKLKVTFTLIFECLCIFDF